MKYKNKFEDYERGDGKIITAINAFSSHLKNEKWIQELLTYVVEEWINKDYFVTDILIREKTVPLVSINKAYIPLTFKDNSLKKRIEYLNRDNFKEVVELLSSYKVRREENSEKEGSVIKDFSFEVQGMGIFRVNYSQDASGSGFSIRYHSHEVRKLTDYAYPETYVNFLKSLLNKIVIKTPNGEVSTAIIRESGLILHVGSTGAGKTTAMAAEVCFFMDRTSGTILTYDMPKEVVYTSSNAIVKQYEIGVNIDIEEVETHAIRNNPTIIQYGEARNKQEYSLVASLASRGHLVLTTMHGANTEEALISLSSATRHHGDQFLGNVLRAIVVHKRITTSEGNILSLHEIVVVDNEIKKLIAKKEFSKITQRINVGGENTQSFQKSLQGVLERGIISKEEQIALNLQKD